MEFKLTTLSDLKKIPSVLSSDELNYFMDILLSYIESNTNSSAIDNATAINDLLGCLAYGEGALSTDICTRILDWTKKYYDETDIDLIDCLTSNLAYLDNAETKEYLLFLIGRSKDDREKEELKSTLEEIQNRQDQYNK